MNTPHSAAESTHLIQDLRQHIADSKRDLQLDTPKLQKLEQVLIKEKAELAKLEQEVAKKKAEIAKEEPEVIHEREHMQKIKNELMHNEQDFKGLQQEIQRMNLGKGNENVRIAA